MLRFDPHRGLADFAAASIADVDFMPDRHEPDKISKLGRILDRLAVDGDDRVPLHEPRAIRRRRGLDGGDFTMAI